MDTAIRFFRILSERVDGMNRWYQPGLLAVIFVAGLFMEAVILVLVLQTAYLVLATYVLSDVQQRWRSAEVTSVGLSGAVAVLIVAASVLFIGLQLLSSYDERIRALKFDNPASPYSGMEDYMTDLQQRIGAPKEGGQFL